MRQPDIVLDVDEQALAQQLPTLLCDHDTWMRGQPAMTALAERLLDRKAIPPVRVRYFADPECNPGGRGKSREDVFEKNGTCGDDILRHPHFLAYLEYFLCGPDLPREIIERFREATKGGYFSGSDWLDLHPIARAAVREYGLNPFEASEEFFKLALECGAPAWSADSLRKTVRAIRK